MPAVVCINYCEKNGALPRLSSTGSATVPYIIIVHIVPLQLETIDNRQ